MFPELFLICQVLSIYTGGHFLGVALKIMQSSLTERIRFTHLAITATQNDMLYRIYYKAIFITDIRHGLGIPSCQKLRQEMVRSQGKMHEHKQYKIID